MIITIDGPVASGKSTVARLLAQKLDLYYLNTGLLYRAVAYLHFERALSLLTIERAAQQHILNYHYTTHAQVFFNEEDLTPLLKTARVDDLASRISVQPEVRELVTRIQRGIAQNHSLVIEGRDCGTDIFPFAEHKFFITASQDVRAERWRKDQEKQQQRSISHEEAVAMVRMRDERDKTRTIAPLRKAADAIEIDTSTLQLQEVVEKILSYIHK